MTSNECIHYFWMNRDQPSSLKNINKNSCFTKSVSNTVLIQFVVVRMLIAYWKKIQESFSFVVVVVVRKYLSFTVQRTQFYDRSQAWNCFHGSLIEDAKVPCGHFHYYISYCHFAGGDDEMETS